jgi:hypothetical protein
MMMFLGIYAAALIYGSFAEWLLHRFVMHQRTFVSFPYELHAVGHHGMFGADETFHALTPEMREHVTFVPRDYLILLGLHAPFLAAAEIWVFPVPFAALAVGLALLTYLHAFNVLHWAFHVPAGRFYEAHRWYKWIKRHHLLHHGSQDGNFNVVFPLADVVLRTLRMGSAKSP